MRIPFTSSLVFLCLLLGACAKPPGIGGPVSWSRLSGWNSDSHADAWPALLNGCMVLPEKSKEWKTICTNAQAIDDPSHDRAQTFFERYFQPHRVNSGKRKNKGLITGYYEPLLQGSFQATKRFQYPVYGRPKELLTVDLGDLYPDMKGKRLRGRLKNRNVVPFYSRTEIDSPARPLRGYEILWVDDRDALFFLHIQGSGRVQLPTGAIINVGYADQNGHPYISIGKILIDRGELEKKDVSLFSIRDWLRKHRDKSQALLNENPSYVFFDLRKGYEDGPIGSLNVPLTAERSAAVDPNTIPLGIPLWIETELPDNKRTEFHRLLLAQDTGGAIKGAVRADIFWGHGEHAELMAGKMKQAGRVFALLPKPQ